MTNLQIELLRSLIRAERDYYWARLEYRWADPELRGVEVGGLSSFDFRTAQSLARAGLVEIEGSPGRLRRAFLCPSV